LLRKSRYGSARFCRNGHWKEFGPAFASQKQVWQLASLADGHLRCLKFRTPDLGSGPRPGGPRETSSISGLDLLLLYKSRFGSRAKARLVGLSTIFFENRAENAGSKEPAFFGQIGPAFLRKAGLEAPVSAETGAGRRLGPFSVGKRA